MKKKVNPLIDLVAAMAVSIGALILLILFSLLIYYNLSSWSTEENSQSLSSYSFSSSLSSEDFIVTEEVLSEQGIEDSIDDMSFASSPDGNSFAYLAKVDDKVAVVVNGESGPSYDSISFMTFSPDSRRFAYGVKEDAKEFVVLDGEPGKKYSWVFSPYFFSPDSQHFIYKTRISEGDIMVVNEQESSAYDRLYKPVISADEKQVIYFGRVGDEIWRTVISLDK